MANAVYTPDFHIKTLRDMKRAAEQALSEVDRKRSWRPSEKAMAKSTYMQRVAACDYAISMIELEMGKGVSPVLFDS